MTKCEIGIAGLGLTLTIVGSLTKAGALLYLGGIFAAIAFGMTLLRLLREQDRAG